MDEQKIIFSNRFEKEKFEDYKTDLGTGNTITPDFTEADDFLKFIQKNRRSVPSKERIADKDKFIKTVYELSNSFEIDADLIEFAEGYIANIYVDYACYTGYIKKLLAILFILADDISFLDGSKENVFSGSLLIFSILSYIPLVCSLYLLYLKKAISLMYPMATQLSSHLFNFPDTVWNF